ncbi:ureidoglycolate lyase [Ketobacter sp. MCCC 1A13808]|uniref:ureidoglycolate lyase n=1 Tax=Ketobacter sp. MCCC 1A13808 TaxID=2602738 RepID=UPI000F0D5EB3|nr:ureidoglycolate lyase [Ketobacter sp. MCCC 1A13808]MVF12061.1 ureidoglycolate lyase [Ketobacter sp. MCCC 1A13808]RLP52857.1 MAG: ureidoglycolate lyase [Ketobacter sp.]
MNRIEPLTQEAFRPFGDVIEANEALENFDINYGYTRRFHNLADINVDAEFGKPIVSLFRSNPLPAPIKIERLERHPLSSQAFMPLGASPYLVVVAPAGELVEANIRVFLAQPGQGVNYFAGTWHHFCLALQADSLFLVIDRAGPGSNCDELLLDTPFTLDISGLV